MMRPSSRMMRANAVALWEGPFVLQKMSWKLWDDSFVMQECSRPMSEHCFVLQEHVLQSKPKPAPAFRAYFLNRVARPDEPWWPCSLHP